MAKEIKSGSISESDLDVYYSKWIEYMADDQLDQLEEYSDCTDRKNALESLIDSSLEVFKDDILDEIKSRKISYLS